MARPEFDNKAFQEALARDLARIKALGAQMPQIEKGIGGAADQALEKGQTGLGVVISTERFAGQLTLDDMADAAPSGAERAFSNGVPKIQPMSEAQEKQARKLWKKQGLDDQEIDEMLENMRNPPISAGELQAETAAGIGQMRRELKQDPDLKYAPNDVTFGEDKLRVTLFNNFTGKRADFLGHTDENGNLVLAYIHEQSATEHKFRKLAEPITITKEQMGIEEDIGSESQQRGGIEDKALLQKLHELLSLRDALQNGMEKYANFSSSHTPIVAQQNRGISGYQI